MGHRDSSDPHQTRPTFVLHEHRRPRPHFDLRLEEDGVLRSWAVPRGLPDDPQHDRLAVAVPDHDLDDATYTDEDKDIADTGWWELVDRTSRRFVFVLHGRNGSRRFALIDTGQVTAQCFDYGDAAIVATTLSLKNDMATSPRWRTRPGCDARQWKPAMSSGRVRGVRAHERPVGAGVARGLPESVGRA